jgi:CubicO group peptidase (beta-lactamase class C family)
MNIPHPLIAAALCTAALLQAAIAAPAPASAPAPSVSAPDLESLPGATSVLLQRGGRVVVEAYARGADAATLHDTRSATKSITALAVAAAVQDGLLQWEQPVWASFEALAPFVHDGPAKRGITVSDLLSMSSALDCNDWNDDSPGNEENMYPQRAWLRWALDLPTRKVARDATGRQPFAYCTAGVFLLGQLLESRVPGGLDAWQAQRLFKPLGITRWQWSRSPSGELMTGGGLRLSTRDLGSLAQLLLQQGRWQGQAVLRPALVQRTLTVQRDGGMGMGYGQLFWQREFTTSCGPQQAWMMAGNGGNLVAVFMATQTSVVLTRTHYNQRQMHQQSWAYVEKLLDAAVCGR